MFSCNRTDLKRIDSMTTNGENGERTRMKFQEVLHSQMVLFGSNQREISQLDDTDDIRSERIRGEKTNRSAVFSVERLLTSR